MKPVINLNRVVKMLAITCMALGAVPLTTFTIDNSKYILQQFGVILHSATVSVAPYIIQFG